MLAAIAEHQPVVIYPGVSEQPDRQPVRRRRHRRRSSRAVGDTGIVVVDEAYQPFAHASFMPRLAEFDNLVVMRTVSKLGLAGIRLGYMAASAALLERIRQGAPAVQHQRADPGRRRVRAGRTSTCWTSRPPCCATSAAALAAELARMAGVDVFPSAANFLLLRVLGPLDAGQVHDRCWSRRCWSKMSVKCTLCCITVCVSRSAPPKKTSCSWMRCKHRARSRNLSSNSCPRHASRKSSATPTKPRSASPSTSTAPASRT